MGACGKATEWVGHVRVTGAWGVMSARAGRTRRVCQYQRRMAKSARSAKRKRPELTLPTRLGAALAILGLRLVRILFIRLRGEKAMTSGLSGVYFPSTDSMIHEGKWSSKKSGSWIHPSCQVSQKTSAGKYGKHYQHGNMTNVPSMTSMVSEWQQIGSESAFRTRAIGDAAAMHGMCGDEIRQGHAASDSCLGPCVEGDAASRVRLGGRIICAHRVSYTACKSCLRT